MAERKDYTPDEYSGNDRFLVRKVEEAIYRCPGVEEVVVVFLPVLDDDYDLTAFIVPSDMSLTPDGVRRYVESSGQLTEEEVPRRYHFIPSIPKTPKGKILRQQLIKTFMEEDF